MGWIDVHAHLLPGVDDGCEDVAESIACARTLVEAGYSHAACTPHIWPALRDNTRANIAQWVSRLQAHLDAAQVPLALFGGGELNLPLCWPQMRDLPRDELITYSFAGRFVLFDFWDDEFPDVLFPAIDHLRELDLQPICAHPERIGVFQKDPGHLDVLAEKGVLFQMNTWCLADSIGLPTRDLAERWLKDDRYFLMGTDTHHARSMTKRIQGIDAAREIAGDERVDRLMRVNPGKLL